MEASQAQEIAELEAKIRALEQERARLEAQLAESAAELSRTAVRLEELEDQHHFDEQRLAVLDRERAGLREALRLAETQDGSSVRLEQRALVRALGRTQTTLDARTEQLGTLLSSRWYRLARSAWQARRRRPPLGATALGAIALAGVIIAGVLASTVATFIACLLGAGIVAALAVAYAVIVPAMRDRRVPRMAGQGTFADPLPDEAAALERFVTRIEAEPEPVTVPAAPSPSVGGPAEVVTRLVPSLPSANTSERDRWLAETRMAQVSQLRIAGVLDDFSRACFAPECELHCEFTMQDWRERLEAAAPHLLLVESAWSGNSGGWQYGVASYPHPDYEGLPALREVISWCRDRGVPTIFWNKEDPIHFERFKEAASLFDHILTTDQNRVSAYEDLRGEHVDSVGALPFAAQPRLHNPVTAGEPRLLEPVFAGTYYRNRHEDRRASLEMILDAARPFGLVIYDRTFGADGDEYGFPERFAPYVKGRRSYQEIVEIYKRHRVFLNVNSVVDSPTMFSRRVFELLASGTAVLSTESVGIASMFGELVPIADSPDDATAKLERLLHDDEYYADLTARASRLVLSEHTYRVRLARIAEVAGFELSPTAGHEVAAVCLIDDASELGHVEQVLLAQSRAPDEILIGLANGALAGRGLERLTEHFGAARVRAIVQTNGLARTERWRELGALSTATWLLPLSPGHSYREHHLRNLSACTGFTAADVIGAAPAETQTHHYVNAVNPQAALAIRSLVARRGWAEGAAEQRQWFDQGVRFYAGDHDATLAPSPGITAAVGHAGAHIPARRARGTRRR